ESVASHVPLTSTSRPSLYLHRRRERPSDVSVKSPDSSRGSASRDLANRLKSPTSVDRSAFASTWPPHAVQMTVAASARHAFDRIIWGNWTLGPAGRGRTVAPTTCRFL